jgi:ABC-type polysaccharide/polyol phosphate export permease
LFQGIPLDFRLLGASLAAALAVFLIGFQYFRKAEKNFADVI